MDGERGLTTAAIDGRWAKGGLAGEGEAAAAAAAVAALISDSPVDGTPTHKNHRP